MPCTSHYFFQILRKYSPDPPKSPEILLQSTSDVTERPLGGLQWTPHSKKFDFNHQKSGPETPRSAQERQQWSEMSGNVQYCSRLFFNTIFNQFCIDFSKLRTWKKWFSSRRNTNFCKIDVLEKVVKLIDLWSIFQEKNYKKSIQICRSEFLCFFLRNFCDFCPPRAPPPETGGEPLQGRGSLTFHLHL